jgi:hypothetical protein
MRTRRVIIVVQVGVTTLLVALAGLLGRALAEVEARSSGWLSDTVVVTPLDGARRPFTTSLRQE